MKKLPAFFLSCFLLIFFQVGHAQVELEWANGIGESENDFGNETGTSIKSDAAGNIYLTGYFSGTVDFDPGTGTADVTAANFSDNFIAKYDADGNYMWVRTNTGAGTEDANSLCLDSYSNVYLAGTFAGGEDFDPGPGTDSLYSEGTDNIFITKYDVNGNYKWTKAIVTDGYDIPTSIAADGSGNIYLTGYFLDTVDFDPGAGTANLFSPSTPDIFLAKYDSNGNYLWANDFGSSNFDVGFALGIDADANVYVTGYFMGTVDFDPGPGTAFLSSVDNGEPNIFLAVYDKLGNYKWAQGFGSTVAGEGNYAFAIALDDNRNVYITGEFANTVDFDPGPATAFLTSGGGEDIYIAKYDKNGNYIWANGLKGAGDQYGLTIAVDQSENVYVGGQFIETVDFDPGNDTGELTAAGGYDIYFARYDAAGALMWAQGLGGPEWESVTSLTLDAADHVYVTGYFSGMVDFDPGADSVNLTSETLHNDLFIAKYSQTDTGNTCETPSVTSVSSITESSAKLHWNEVPEALRYEVRYKPSLSSDWHRFAPIGNSTKIKDLIPSTEYAWEVKSICGVNPLVASPWSPKKFFTTDPLRISNEEKEVLMAYPNPASTVLNIKCESGENGILLITNSLGQIVFRETVSWPEMKIDVSSYADGLYLLQMKTSAGMLTQKFVKE